jgi:hypothetical protein
MSWLITGSQKVNWNPSLITTALWLDAADATTVTTVSGAVSQWNDKSGNARHATQSTAGNRPSYTTAGQNGRNVLTFDGSSDGLTLASNLSLGTEHSIFVAAKNSATITTSTAPQALLCGDTYTFPSTTTSELIFGVGSLTGNFTNERIYSLALAAGTGAADVYGYGKTDSDIAGGFIALSSFASTGNVFSGRFNGAADFVSTSSAGGYSTTNTRFPSNLRSIGYRFANNTLFWSGQIWELIVVPSYLSLDATHRIEGYLAHKWGLTANLPAGHPYKINPPAP